MSPDTSGKESNTVSKEAVGARLRALRKRKGFTLKRLSEVLGVPLSTLSKIELAQTALSYDKFRAVSQALGVELIELLQPTESAADRIEFAGQVLKARVDDYQDYVSENYLHTFLFSEVRGKAMTPIASTIFSRELKDFKEFIRHPGQEFVYVLSGAIKILFEDGRSLELKKNEVAYFDSTIGHAYLARSRAPARVLVMCSDRS